MEYEIEFLSGLAMQRRPHGRAYLKQGGI